MLLGMLSFMGVHAMVVGSLGCIGGLRFRLVVFNVGRALSRRGRSMHESSDGSPSQHTWAVQNTCVCTVQAKNIVAPVWPPMGQLCAGWQHQVVDRGRGRRDSGF